MKKILQSFVLIAMLSGSFLFAYANGQIDKVINVSPSTSAWTRCYDNTRTGDYSYVQARVLSIDHSSISTLKSTVFNINQYQISGLYTLMENAGGYSNLYINEGYISTNPVYIAFRTPSTTSSSYQAWVRYDSK